MNNNYIEQKKNNFLCFEIGNSKYAINSSNVLEIMKLPELDYPQKLPNNIIGILKYNHFVINVIDVRFYLGIEVTPYNVSNDLLIVKTDEIIYGIIANKTIGLLPFDAYKIDTIPFNDNKQFISSLYKNNDETIFILDIYSLENRIREKDNGETSFNVQSLLPHNKEEISVLKKRREKINQNNSFSINADVFITKKKYLSLNLNSDFYCISINYLKEVIKEAQITKIPQISKYIEGIINLRGDYIPVINLKKFLEIDKTDTQQSNKPIIIIEINELRVGLLVDKINELLDYKELELNINPDSYFIDKFIFEGNLYTILNIDKIINDKKIIIDYN